MWPFLEEFEVAKKTAIRPEHLHVCCDRQCRHKEIIFDQNLPQLSPK